LPLEAAPARQPAALTTSGVLTPSAALRPPATAAWTVTVLRLKRDFGGDGHRPRENSDEDGQIERAGAFEYRVEAALSRA
jgi:hypothetical protein